MKTETKNNSPLPWNVEHPFGEPGVYIAAPDTSLVAKIYGNGPYADANADLVVRAVNSHADLLSALESVAKFYQDNFDAMPVAFQTFDHIVSAAIAKAKGGAS